MNDFTSLKLLTTVHHLLLHHRKLLLLSDTLKPMLVKRPLRCFVKTRVILHHPVSTLVRSDPTNDPRFL